MLEIICLFLWHLTFAWQLNERNAKTFLYFLIKQKLFVSLVFLPYSFFKSLTLSISLFNTFSLYLSLNFYISSILCLSLDPIVSFSFHCLSLSHKLHLSLSIVSLPIYLSLSLSLSLSFSLSLSLSLSLSSSSFPFSLSPLSIYFFSKSFFAF